ncbi:AraC family transcriptional regulator [Lactiplantibacillus sp. WILCCON 0030]|uniref:AraC family transcriptional regulator n=1 Tax=Lactiplantibacillus brownii TaxID=3069269 RepID=A0ABU1AEN8_9LACO|nr:AraC family transcriptional regulator [Lactiplantibacillus brownii]MDQ7938703.1 AraC family transcriptional regulator [Lactiplantibacillus brownii]
MLKLKEFIPDVLYAFPYRNDQPGTYIYHKHTFLELSIMLTGYSDYNVEGRWRRVVAGQALLFNPGVHHQETQPPASQSLQLHIGFRHVALPGQTPDHLPFADSLINFGPLQTEFMACAQRVVTESQRPSEFGHEVLLQALVVELLCLLLRALPENAVSSDYLSLKDEGSVKQEHAALVSAATYYLEAHYSEELTLSSLAATLHISPAVLSRTFKTVQGESPINYLTKLRMRRAKDLLAKEQLTVGEVSRSVGYQDPLYFSKLFKRYFGMAPSLINK